MSTTYQFDGFVFTQRFNADWSVTTNNLTRGTIEIDPPGTKTSFTLEEWGVELADVNGGSFSFSTPTYGPVTDTMGDGNPVMIQILSYPGGTTTVVKIDRHVRLADDTLVGFDTILIPISGPALPTFATADAFAAWYGGLPWTDPTETYPVGTEFVWENFDIDITPRNGTSGADTMVGTTGDDILNGLGGNDLLRGNRGDDLLSGGNGNDRLEGGQGADTLNGNAGNDILRGGEGNETDVLNGGTGIDTVDYSDLTMGFQAGGLIVNLSTGRTSGSFYVGRDQLVSIENANGTNGADTLTGGTDSNRLRGLAGDDRLLGLAGADTLEGGTGRDTLIGGKGNDSLTGGDQADAFVFNTALSGRTNVDRITDFDAVDKIHLETDIFRAIGASLSAAEFKLIASGTSFATVDASDHLIYQKSTGKLYYDPDGSGSAARVLFAQVDANTQLSLDDFVMI